MSRRRSKRQRHDFSVSPVLSAQNIEQWAYDSEGNDTEQERIRATLQF
jgi:hypothetical protein